LISHLLAPLQGLMVKVGQGGEGARREEAPTGVLNGALDAPFFITPGGAARAGSEVVVGGEFEQAGMEMNGIAAALEYHAFQIVIQNGSGGPTPIGEGMDVAEEKILQGLIEEELQPQGAAVGEGQQEGGQAATGTADGDFAKVGPIGLCLLAGEGVKAEEGFAARRAQFGDDTPELTDAAGVTARANHLEEAGGAQARILLQGLTQEVEIGIREAITKAGMAAEAVGVQGGAYGIGMQAELGRKRADLPMLGMEEMADASDLFIGNHASSREKD